MYWNFILSRYTKYSCPSERQLQIIGNIFVNKKSGFESYILFRLILNNPQWRLTITLLTSALTNRSQLCKKFLPVDYIARDMPSALIFLLNQNDCFWKKIWSFETKNRKRKLVLVEYQNCIFRLEIFLRIIQIGWKVSISFVPEFVTRWISYCLFLGCLNAPKIISPSDVVLFCSLLDSPC